MQQEKKIRWDLLESRIFALEIMYEEHRECHPETVACEIRKIKEIIESNKDEPAKKTWLNIYEAARSKLIDKEIDYQDKNPTKTPHKELLEALEVNGKIRRYPLLAFEDYLNKIKTKHEDVARKEILVNAVLDRYSFERELLWLIPVLHVYLKNHDFAASVQFRHPYSCSAIDASNKELEKHFNAALEDIVGKRSIFLVESRHPYFFINGVVIDEEVKRL